MPHLFANCYRAVGLQAASKDHLPRHGLSRPPSVSASHTHSNQLPASSGAPRWIANPKVVNRSASMDASVFSRASGTQRLTGSSGSDARELTVSVRANTRLTNW